MNEWAIAGAVAVALALILLFLPIRLRFSFRGRADPSGAWALAAGAQLGPIAGSGVAARGIETTLQAHLFGRSIYKRTLAEVREKRRRERDETESDADTKQ